jgi:hypothetical protein
MRRSGTGSGGGFGSNKVTHRNAPKVEPRAHGINPGGVAQLGTSIGNHVTKSSSSSYRGDPWGAGRGYSPPVGPTDNVAACGVGKGRTVHASGSQGQQGPIAGSVQPKGRDIL